MSVVPLLFIMITRTYQESLLHTSYVQTDIDWKNEIEVEEAFKAWVIKDVEHINIALETSNFSYR